MHGNVEWNESREIEFVEFICKQFESIVCFFLKLWKSTLGLKSFFNKPDCVVGLEVTAFMRFEDRGDVNVGTADLDLNKIAIDLTLEF